VIKKVTGKTPLDLIAHIIILDAKAQLKSTSLSVKEIAINLGYSNVAFFDKYFKRYVGITPLEYRNS
jgi:YesN/AraC family two-component response regulator